MSRKAIVLGVVWASLAGGAVALLTGSQQTASLRIWLAVSVAWFAGTALLNLVDAVPPEGARLQLLVRRVRKPAVQPVMLRGLRNLNGLILRSTNNPRAFEQQLRPRLVSLATHYLSLNHNLDLRADAERVQGLLDPVGWLIDPSVKDRTPSIDELESFFATLLPSSVHAIGQTRPDDVGPDRVQPDGMEPDRVEPDRVEPDQMQPEPRIGAS